MLIEVKINAASLQTFDRSEQIHKPFGPVDRQPKPATAAIWITNLGLESTRATVTFKELFEMLRRMGGLADQLSTLTKIN